MEKEQAIANRTALITGGSGYLGSHLSKKLKQQGWKVIILDIKEPTHSYVDAFYCGDIRRKYFLESIFQNHFVDVVFHLAGRIEVGESVKYPTEFWDVNVGGTVNVLNVMKNYGVNKIIFSSTAGVYWAGAIQIPEDECTTSNNPYSNSKMSCEYAIEDSGLNYVIFRYFNLAGADPDGEMGESNEPETHLIPRILQNLNTVEVYGNDYDTPDGTCIRDYVHVCDVVDAHLEAVKYLDNSGESGIFNLGSGVGYSVLDVIKTVEKISSKKVKYNIVPRRKGDPNHLVADITKAKTILNFNPKHDISSIIKSAYEWEKSRSTT